eukprot:Skav236504  [mRNA]  locus=scaffold78:316727:320924:+ [translate_table: standard]
MTRGIRSRIFHEPDDISNRHRDLFPLPSLRDEFFGTGDVCHAVKRRIYRKHHMIKRVNLAIDSLNSLFYGGGKRFEHRYTGDLGSLPMSQRDSLRSIIQSVGAFGTPPQNASRSGALQALRTTSDGYSSPEAGVGSVCNMVLQRLSLPSGRVAGVDLGSVLEEPLRTMVTDFEDWMMVDGDTWAAVSGEAHAVRTYNDPSLYDHHQYIRLRALQLSPDDLIKDGNPPPLLRDGSMLAMPYCGNVHCISTSKELADEGKSRIAVELEGMGFTLHEDEDANSFFQTLGGVFDGVTGSIAPTSKRAWDCILAFEYLLENVVSCELVQQLIGHSVVIFVLNRCGMCIFRHLYDFIQADGPPRLLSRSEIEEVKIFIGLVPLLFGNIRLEWSNTVTATDASPYGYGICERSMSTEEVRSMGRWQERWRFKHLDPSEWRPRDRAEGRCPLTDVRTARPFYSPPSIDELYEVDGNFPEVPIEVAEFSTWKTVLMGRWRDTSEHITLKEGRALVLAARRLTRNSSSRGKRHLVLVDNLALSMMVCKGRATNFGMLRVMQQLSALSLAGGFVIKTRWLPSERNPADGPSRGQVEPGPYQANWAEAKGSPQDEPSPEGDSEAVLDKELWKQGSEYQEDGDSETRKEEANQCKEASSGEEEREKSVGQSPSGSARVGQVGQDEQVDCSGETLSEFSHRGAVPELSPEVCEFLPGARARVAPITKHRCKSSGLHGCTLLRGQAHERRGEDLSELGISARKLKRKVGSLSKSSSWLAKRVPSRITSTSAETGGLRNQHVATGKGQETPCTESDPGLRHLHASQREPRPSEKEPGLSSFEGWTPIQMVCPGDQRLRRKTSRQSGHLRQQCAFEQQRKDLVGQCGAQACEDPAIEHVQDLPIRCGRFSEADAVGSHAVGSERGSPVSASSWRSGGRPERKGVRSPRSEDQGKMADRSIGASLHKGGKDSADSQPSLTCKNGVLSLVTPQLDEGFQRTSSSKTALNPVTTDVFLCKSKPHRFALELFAGTARVAAALCAIGICTFPIDICLFSSHDVLDKFVEHTITNWIRSHRISFMWIGMPCTTFSRARKHDGLGPGPLRDPQHLWGLPGLGKRDRLKLSIGNSLFQFTIRIMRLCEKYNIPYALENPATSMAWDMLPLCKFCRQFSPKWCQLDYCQFGERWKKPTGILYNFVDLTPLNKQCNSQSGLCSRTGRQHVRLAGTDHNGTFMTLRAQPYPLPMASLVAKQVARTLQG